jgi:outer membrane protein assembly factor BamB
LAIDPVTGKNIWKHLRKTDAVGEALEAYSTPIVFENNGHMEIAIAGSDHITGHDVKSGEELWRFGYNPAKITVWNTVPTPVRGDGVVYAAIGRGKRIIAVNTSQTGLLSEKDVAWTFEGPTPDVCSPLYYKGNLYVLDGRRKNIVTCLDAKTGKQKWQGKLEGKGPWRASLTASDDKIYCISEAAQVVVLDADDREFKVIFRMEMNDKPSHASIAIADGHLFIRTATRLYCVQ